MFTDRKKNGTLPSDLALPTSDRGTREPGVGNRMEVWPARPGPPGSAWERSIFAEDCGSAENCTKYGGFGLAIERSPDYYEVRRAHFLTRCRSYAELSDNIIDSGERRGLPIELIILGRLDHQSDQNGVVRFHWFEDLQDRLFPP